MVFFLPTTAATSVYRHRRKLYPSKKREREKKKSRVDTWQAEVVKTAREKYYNVRPRNNHVSSVYKGERGISQEK